jgi:hypothetical protein
MSWIKDNKFLVALGSGTLVGLILIFLVGAKGATRYQQAKEDFDLTQAEVKDFEGRKLYPRQENCDGKHKALAEYREATEALQAAFANFRPKDLKNVSPQDFTTQLKAADEKIRKACEESGTKLPESFFCGFENYQTTLAKKDATGILGYELAGIEQLMLALAHANAAELKNLYRPLLLEEGGREYKPQDSDVARPLPLEITFSGPEKAVRAFFSALTKFPAQYFVIRSIAVSNTKKDPPRAIDAKFDKPAVLPGAAADEAFGGGFVLPGEEPKTEDKKTAPAPGPAPKKPVPGATPPLTPAPAPAPAEVDSSRILSQVLGIEELQVFVRLDLMLFLPAKKLP